LKEDGDAFEIPSANAFGFFHQSARLIAFAPDDSRFFSANDRIVKVFDSKTGAQLGTIPSDGTPVHSSAITGLALSPDGKILATASWDHSIELWNAIDFSRIRSLKGHLNEVWSIAFSPDGKSLLSGAKDGGVYLWPIDSPAHNEFIAGDWQPIGFSSDEKTLAVANRGNDTIGLLVVESPVIENSNTQAHTLHGRQNPFLSRPSASRNFKIIAHRLGDSQIEIVNRDGRRLALLEPTSQPIIAAVVSPDGKSIATVTWGGAATVRNLSTSRNTHLSARGELALFTSDSKRLLLVSRDGTVTIWNSDSNLIEKTIALEMPPGFPCALSPDDHILATAAAPDLSNTILLTDIRDGKAVGTLAGHKQGIHSLAFAPDGKTLASASGDGSLKLWNIPTLQEILTFTAQANNLVFSPGGHFLVFNSRQNGSEGIAILRSELP
jgi:WD40 repeat protein